MSSTLKLWRSSSQPRLYLQLTKGSAVGSVGTHHQLAQRGFSHTNTLREPNTSVPSSAAAVATPQVKESSSRLEKLRKRLIEEDTDGTQPFSPFLTDKFGRNHNYLRISVSERCNLRCTYCMPEEGVPLTPTAKLLSAEEITRVARIFVSQGVNKVRITGGEPLLRKDLTTIISNISSMSSMESIGITTNGILLTRLLPDLLKAGVTHINVSLDSLIPTKFEKISRRPPSAWHKVWKGLHLASDLMAQQLGNPVKINCVVMKGTNEEEICDFVQLTQDLNIDVRFIEYMPFSGNKWDLAKMFPYQEMVAKIKERFPDFQKLEDPFNHTAKAYQVRGHVGKVGFITSMSDHFCAGCNRLRITADGNLKVCLFGNAEVSLRDAIRKGATEEDLLALIGQAVSRKHAKHAGMMNLAKMENRPMILIGNSKTVPIPKKSFSEEKEEAGVKLKIQGGGEVAAESAELLTGNREKKEMKNLLPIWPMHSTIVGAIPNSHVDASSSSSSPLLFKTRVTMIPSMWHKAQESQQLCYYRGTPSNFNTVNNGAEQQSSSVSSSSLSAPNKAGGEEEKTSTSLSHVDSKGKILMVDVSDKRPTVRSATAEATVQLSSAAFRAVAENKLKKGDVLTVAQVAGILGAKQTSNLIPLCHPLPLSKVDVSLSLDEGTESIRIEAMAKTQGVTGVEMEALTAAAVAALTIYDMCKAVDKSIVIGKLRLVKKTGGKSDYLLGKSSS